MKLSSLTGFFKHITSPYKAGDSIYVANLLIDHYSAFIDALNFPSIIFYSDDVFEDVLRYTVGF